jgi:phosphonate transport system substrate-binding protein
LRPQHGWLIKIKKTSSEGKMRRLRFHLFKFLTAAALGLSLTSPAAAQNCPNRGDLDKPYCDADKDLVADAPASTVNPQRIFVGISQTEDALTARKTYSGFLDYLGSCLKREVLLFPSVGEPAVLEGMRTGQVHIGQFATGGTMYAVNFAGGVPFAGKGKSSVGRIDAYTLMLIVRSESSYRKPADLAGKKIAHTSASSNSGNLAPRALFPQLGLRPEQDYKVEYSGKHDKSIMGVALGLYDGAAIASDVFERLVAKGEIKRNQFRVLYESEPFPPDAFVYRHDLNPKLAGEIRKCFAEFKFPQSMSNALENNDRFYPVDYAGDWKIVRTIAKASGTLMDQAGYQKLIAPPKR